MGGRAGVFEGGGKALAVTTKSASPPASIKYAGQCRASVPSVPGPWAGASTAGAATAGAATMV
ncbi:hypothetical protein tb265_19140 [Gemmatimonadetes bacterium T265]|nr:hypothetical protein tb265_19140 [Gemmatimonadetes bacterium T265]